MLYGQARASPAVERLACKPARTLAGEGCWITLVATADTEIKHGFTGYGRAIAGFASDGPPGPHALRREVATGIRGGQTAAVPAGLRTGSRDTTVSCMAGSSSQSEWVVILGASSGFGAAVSRELAGRGFNVCGVHLDRRSTVAAAQRVKSDVEAAGVRALFFNVNAADEGKRRLVIDELARHCEAGKLRLLLHSLAFGSLLTLVGEDEKSSAKPSQITMTMDVMAHSLVYWSRELFWRRLLGQGGRILAMSSAGSTRAMPGYGLVSAAKSALEAYIRQLALELGPMGISANTVRAGITDTPALRKIPGHETMMESALRASPAGRLTTPGDVASAVALLIEPGAAWISGNVIGVDGGEDVVAG